MSIFQEDGHYCLGAKSHSDTQHVTLMFVAAGADSKSFDYLIQLYGEVSGCAGSGQLLLSLTLLSVTLFSSQFKIDISCHIVSNWQRRVMKILLLKQLS